LSLVQFITHSSSHHKNGNNYVKKNITEKNIVVSAFPD